MQVTHVFASPFIANNLLTCPDISSYDSSSLSTLCIGGGVVAEHQILSLREHFPHTVICYGYGMTESQGNVTFLHPVKEKEIILKKIKSVGRGLPGYSYKVIYFKMVFL